MKKKWNIKVADKEYVIGLTLTDWIVNGTKYPKKTCVSFSKYFIFKEYKLPIPEAEVYMVSGTWSYEPVVDGVNISTGELHHRMENVPGWVWVFVGFNMCLVVGGAIGGIFAALGALSTIAICANPKNTTTKKVVSSILVLLSAWGLYLI